jgi:hypothetical protein
MPPQPPPAQNPNRPDTPDPTRRHLQRLLKQPLGAYLAECFDGQRLAPATLASYRKNVRLHVAP